MLIARRRIVEIADGFKERIRGEAANLPLEASKRLTGKLEQLGRIRQVAGNRILNEQIHAPESALRIIGEMPALLRLHQRQRFAVRVSPFLPNDAAQIIRHAENIADDGCGRCRR